MRRLLRKLAGDTGAEIAEAALVLPIAFMFLLGIVWFGRAFNVYSTITQAAQQGALAAARPSCATCGNLPLTDAQVDAAIFGVLQSSRLDPTQIPAITNPPGLVPCTLPPPAPPGGCTNTKNITICRFVILNPPTGDGFNQPLQCGAIVRFQYPFQFFLPFTSLSMQQITLTAEAQSRMEN